MLETPEFWVAAAFVVFVVLLWKPAGEFLTNALDARAEAIRKELAEAARLREEAQRLLAKYEGQQREAAQEAAAIIGQAKAEAEILRTRAVTELEAVLKRREAAAVERIHQAEVQAVADVRAAAVDLAVAATRKLIGETLTPDRADALIDQSIRDLPTKLN